MLDLIAVYVSQVKQLQSKVTGLLRERTDALSLNTHIEERHNILTAQLKAKVNRVSFFFTAVAHCLKYLQTQDRLAYNNSPHVLNH